MEELNHQTSETLKSSRNSHGRGNLDQHALCSVDVDLQFSSLVDGRVEEG